MCLLSDHNTVYFSVLGVTAILSCQIFKNSCFCCIDLVVTIYTTSQNSGLSKIFKRNEVPFIWTFLFKNAEKKYFCCFSGHLFHWNLRPTRTPLSGRRCSICSKSWAAAVSTLKASLSEIAAQFYWHLQRKRQKELCWSLPGPQHQNDRCFLESDGCCRATSRGDVWVWQRWHLASSMSTDLIVLPKFAVLKKKEKTWLLLTCQSGLPFEAGMAGPCLHLLLYIYKNVHLFFLVSINADSSPGLLSLIKTKSKTIKK